MLQFTRIPAGPDFCGKIEDWAEDLSARLADFHGPLQPPLDEHFQLVAVIIVKPVQDNWRDHSAQKGALGLAVVIGRRIT